TALVRDRGAGRPPRSRGLDRLWSMAPGCFDNSGCPPALGNQQSAIPKSRQPGHGRVSHEQSAQNAHVVAAIVFVWKVDSGIP
ncbi:MAG: hypothetical protein AAFS08_18650, partial [Pseudomonadota bacterium]